MFRFLLECSRRPSSFHACFAHTFVLRVYYGLTWRNAKQSTVFFFASSFVTFAEWNVCSRCIIYAIQFLFVFFFFFVLIILKVSINDAPFFPHCFRFVTMEQWFCGMNDQTAVGSMMMHPEKKSNNITQTHTRLHPWIVYTTAVPFLIVSYRSVRLHSSSNADTHFGIQKRRKAFLLGYSGVAPFLQLVKRMNKYGGNNNNQKPGRRMSWCQ